MFFGISGILSPNSRRGPFSEPDNGLSCPERYQRLFDNAILDLVDIRGVCQRKQSKPGMCKLKIRMLRRHVL